VTVPGADPLAFWGAAYQITGRAHAVIGGEKGRPSVTLWPRPDGRAAGLVEDFLAVYADQRLRWAVERGNMDVRAEILRRALSFAERSGAGPAPQVPSLTGAQKAEIARMLAQAEAAERDPLGIAAPWEERKAS
jgi:hypothetical protein